MMMMMMIMVLFRFIFASLLEAKFRVKISQDTDHSLVFASLSLLFRSSLDLGVLFVHAAELV